MSLIDMIDHWVVPSLTFQLRGEPALRPAALAKPAVGMGRLIALGIGAVWASVVLILCARLIGGRLVLSRLRTGAAEADPASLGLLEVCRRELGLARAVGIAVHRAIASPVTLGGRAALVVVPPDWLDWCEADRRACLLHELTHLAHRDDWVKLVQEIARIPFFFHPLVSWVLSRLDRERELLCDEAVVALGTDPVAYAELLLDLARRPGRLLLVTRPRCAGWLPFLDRGTIADRIQRLLEVDMTGHAQPSGFTPRGILLAGVAAIGVAVAVGGVRFRAGEARAAEQVTPRPGAPEARIPVKGEKPSAGRISGVVLDPAGRPVALAAIVIGVKMQGSQPAADSPDTDRHLLESDANGCFECPAPEGRYIAYLYAYKEGFAPAAALFSQESELQPPPQLRLAKPQPFRAKLVDGKGSPIANADVRITMLATGPFEDEGGSRVGFGLEHIRWEFVRGSPLQPFYAAKTDQEGNVVFPALREGGGMKFDAIDGNGRRSWRIGRETLGGHRVLVGSGFAARAHDGPAILTLVPAARLSGRVISKLPDIVVAGLHAFVQSTALSRRHQQFEAVVDAEGRFAIDGLDEGLVNVYVSGRGSDDPWTYHAVPEVPLRAGETAEVKIELIRGVEVDGRVFVLGTKQPVPNAQVAGRELTGRPEAGGGRSATTDALGRYRFRLPPGKARLSIFGTPPGFTTLTDNVSGATVTLADGATQVEAPPLEVVPALTVRGRVVDAVGVAVRGAQVAGTCAGGACRPFPGREVVTDAEGEFRLPSGLYNTIPIGQIARLLIRLRDGTEHEAAATPAADGSVTIKLAALHQKLPNVRGPRDVAPQDLAGIVVDTEGEPLGGVEVDAWTWYPGNETRTDKRGWFRLLNLGKDEKVEIMFRKPGYTPRLFLAQPAGTKDWVIVLGDKTYFEGKVTDASGKPVVDALIRANRGPKRPQPGYMITDIWSETKSRTGGLYRLYAEADAYEIQVAVPGVGAARLRNQVLATDEAKRLDIRLDRGVTFRAKVVDSLTHEPVSGVRLWHWQHRGVEGKSGKDGTVTIPDMMPGRFAFDVDAPGYARWWSEQAATEWSRHQILKDRGGWQRNFDFIDFELTAGMEPVTITLERAVTITGRVLDPDGKPVAGATVAPALTGTGNSLTGDTRFSVQTDKDGQFTMTLPASGGRQYNLVAHDGKYQEWRNWANGILPAFAAKPGQEIRGVELKLTKPATVRGRVTDRDGKPIANREVRAAAADLLENRYYDPTVKTAADGTFELKFIRPGEQSIQVAPFWLDPRQAPVELSQTLTLKPGEIKADVEFRIQANAR
ncbi:MAG: carboxypeptidase regulatory-like domain-containing protein [Isosphaeraceae bacterium]